MSYFEEYYSNYAGMSVDEYVENYIRSSPLEMGRIIDTVALMPDGVSSVLDVGAGHGVFLEELQRRKGIAGVGIEITDLKIDYARARGVDMRKGDASRLDFADKSFDAVVSCEVLEHLPWRVYEAALGEFSRVARQWIIITIPNKENRVFAKCPYCGASTNPSYHFRSFDEETMKRLIPGFELDRTLLIGLEKQSVLTLLQPFRSATWQDFMICPSCNYRKTASGYGQLRHSATQPSRRNQFIRLVSGLSPKITRARWLIGIYRKSAQGSE